MTYNLYMLKNRQDIAKLIKEFDALCKKEGIWYSLANETMLGAIRHGGFVPWVEKFSVMIDVPSLDRLLKAAPGRVISSLDDKTYKSLSLSFVEDKNNWKANQAFIEIMVIVPTTVEKIAKFTNPLTIIKNKLTLRANNIKIAIVDLLEKSRFNGYLLVKSRKQELQTIWIQSLPTFEVVEKEFMGIKVPVLKCYDQILKAQFGKNYLIDTNVPNKWYEYPAPLKKVEVK